MSLFSNCSGPCCICGCAGFCLAGNGDDDFYPASMDKIVERLNKNMYPDYVNLMVGELRSRGVEYDMKNLGSVPYKDPDPIPPATDEEVNTMIAEVFG